MIRSVIRRTSSPLVSVTAAMTGCLLLSGCSSFGGGPADGPDSEVASFQDQVSVAIDEAEAGGASDQQLTILREAQTEGRVTFDHARMSILTTVECVEDGGGVATYYEDAHSSGMVIPTFILEAKDDAGLDRFGPLIDECGNLESYWVNKVYQLQPTSQEARDAYLETQAPVIRECLESHGHLTDPSATPIELVRQAAEVANDSDGTINCQ